MNSNSLQQPLHGHVRAPITGGFTGQCARLFHLGSFSHKWLDQMVFWYSFHFGLLYESSQVGKMIYIYKCNGLSQKFYNRGMKRSFIVKKKHMVLCSTYVIHWTGSFPLSTSSGDLCGSPQPKPHPLLCFSYMSFLLGFAESAKTSTTANIL